MGQWRIILLKATFSNGEEALVLKSTEAKPLRSTPPMATAATDFTSASPGILLSQIQNGSPWLGMSTWSSWPSRQPPSPLMLSRRELGTRSTAFHSPLRRRLWGKVLVSWGWARWDDGGCDMSWHQCLHYLGQGSGLDVRLPGHNQVNGHWQGIQARAGVQMRTVV